jgi:hypothetical protein
VRDKETGMPVAGVLVTGLLTESWTWTDAQGRYELHGYPKSARYGILAMPDQQGAKWPPRQDLLYFRTSVEVPDKPGLDSIVADLEMSRGILFQGKLTDKVTGKPVPGFVSYYPLRPNENVRDVPGFANIRNFAAYDADTSHFGAHSIDEAAADGSFRCLVLPGPGAVCVQAAGNHYQEACVDPRAFIKVDSNSRGHGSKWAFVVPVWKQGAVGRLQENYQAIALINPEKETKAITCDIALEPARKVKGIVLGPDDKPLSGTQVRGLRQSDGPWEKLGETSEFSMVLPNPERPRTLCFRHEDKRLVGQLTVTGREEGLTVRLEPWGTVEGRLITTVEGEPLPDVRVGSTPWFYSLSHGPAALEVEVVKTDKNGRFVLAGLLPGKVYNLRFRDGRDPKKDPPPGGFVVKDLTLKAGETKDLGNIVAVYDTIRE